jgi:hypothetical protein
MNIIQAAQETKRKFSVFVVDESGLMGRDHFVKILDAIAKEEVTGGKAACWLGWAQCTAHFFGAPFEGLASINREAGGWNEQR